MPAEHITKQFDIELETVRAKVLEMGGLVESQIKSAVDALHRGDCDLARRVIELDHRVNALEVSIDEDCNHIIARRQPAAGDLRLILAIIKTITDLERIGDEASKIARMTILIHNNDRNIPSFRMDLRHIAHLAMTMLNHTLDAYARLDINEATQILRDDFEVDEAFRSILRQLITFMMEDPRTISNAIEFLFAAKALERIGDHATNMAEYVIFLVKGKDVRHTSVEEVEQSVRN
ncbi:MAG: phosphate signaling complex protein PhoU [Ferrovum sp.]|jgi:phosphate transport system protein|nr:phosphate signaling complex protein PhoU [Ferrovum sp.]